jgi:hypothetical protein
VFVNRPFTSGRATATFRRPVSDLASSIIGQIYEAENCSSHSPDANHCAKKKQNLSTVDLW